MEKQQGIFERFALRISDWSENGFLIHMFCFAWRHYCVYCCFEYWRPNSRCSDFIW